MIHPVLFEVVNVFIKYTLCSTYAANNLAMSEQSNRPCEHESMAKWLIRCTMTCSVKAVCWAARLFSGHFLEVATGS
jgi:hypothetical protein